MAELVRDGIRAGALGFSTSRTIMHTRRRRRTGARHLRRRGRAVRHRQGARRARHRALRARARGRDGRGPRRRPSARWRGCAGSRPTIGRPVSFALSQHNLAPDQWRDVLRLAQEANAEGADLRGQVGGRPLNLLIGFQTFHPFLGPAHLPEDRRPAAGRAGRRAAPARGARGDPGSETSPASPLDAVIGTGLDVHVPDRRAARLRARPRAEHRRHRRPRAAATPRRCCTT